MARAPVRGQSHVEVNWGNLNFRSSFFIIIIMIIS